MQESEEPNAKKSRVSQSYSESYKPLFKQIFPELVKELTEDGLKDPEVSDGVRHLEEVCVKKAVMET